MKSFILERAEGTAIALCASSFLPFPSPRTGGSPPPSFETIFTVRGAARRRQTMIEAPAGSGEVAGCISRGFEPKTFSLDK